MKFNWILINQFAIGTPINTKKDKELLKERGIISVLDLRNSDDLNAINQREYIEKLSGFEYQNVQLPDHRSGRLSEPYEIRQAVDMLDSFLLKGPVFMHCHAAVERCPLISIAYLHIKKGYKIINSCEFVKQQNRSTIVNMKQIKNINN